MSRTDLTPTLIYMPFDEATTPKNGECVTDRWWIVHPEKGVAFHVRGKGNNKLVAPQCNSDRRIAEHLVEMYPGHEVREIPVVFRGTGQFHQPDWNG